MATTSAQSPSALHMPGEDVHCVEEPLQWGTPRHTATKPLARPKTLLGRVPQELRLCSRRLRWRLAAATVSGAVNMLLQEAGGRA